MSGNSYYEEGTASAAGKEVEILGSAGFTAKQVLIKNDHATETLSIGGLNEVNLVSLKAGEKLLVVGRFKILLMINAAAAATFRVWATDSATPQMSLT